jgi:[pyruvate, water dikinase]-phosphate phosphotransferase / [pyruvate, water dikinase] kinase
VPYVLDCPLPPALEILTKPLIVGLTINPDRLQQIRKTRLQTLKSDKDTNYVDMELLQREITESRKLFSQRRWPVIDVSKRSVEETAATILQYYQRHEKKAEAAND